MFSKIFLLFFAAAALPAAEAPSALSQEWLLDQLRLNNPEVRAAQLEADEAEALALGASSWPAPRLSYELMQAPNFDLGNYGVGRTELTQELPFPGRATLQGRVAGHAAMRKREAARIVFEDQVFEARMAYWSLASAAYTARMLSKSVEAFAEIKGVSASRGRFGRLDRMGQVMDAMIGMEAGSMQSMQPHWKQERLKAEAALNRLSGAEAARALPDPPEDPLLLAGAEAPDPAALESAIERYNPELAEAGHHILHADAMRQEAREEWLPDLMIEAGLEDSRDGMREGTLKAGFTLPWLWFGRTRGANGAASAEWQHAMAMQQAMRLKLDEEARVALGELESSREELRLMLESALPAAERAMREAIAGFKNGGVEAEQARQGVMGYWNVQERIGHLIGHVGESQATLQRLMATASQKNAKEMSHE